MLFLVWNVQIYMYDLRILRYLVLLAALIFDLMYFFFGCMLFDYAYYRHDTSNVFEIFQALFIAYCIGLYFPTALINYTILFKELTLNQMAWSKD